jgi:hypothetical protein
MSSIVISGDTSGTVTLSAPAVAGSTTLTLPSTSGTVLTNKTAGAVLQVVQGTTSTSVTSSTSTFVDTGLTATITPSSASNKILIFISQAETTKKSGSSAPALALKIQRNGSDVIQFAQYLGYTGTDTNLYLSANYQWLDSPASTSALTYKTQFRNTSGAGTVYVQDDSMTSSIVLMEIAG